MKHFQAFLDTVLPDRADQVRLQMFFGAFIERGKFPGFLVLCGDGCGAWAMYGVIAHMLGGQNVSEVAMGDLAHDPEAASGALDVACNVCHDLTSEGSYSFYYGAMRRICVDGVLVDGFDRPAPRIVVMSRFVPDVSKLPPALGRVAVVVEFSVIQRLSLDFSPVLAEMPKIRAWARAGLKLLEDAGGFEGCVRRAA